MTEESPRVDTQTRNRNRGMLILILVLFFGSMLVAGALRFSGWQPEGRRNHGELLDPPVDMREASLALVDGGHYAWQPGERIWRILVAPPARCDTACADVARDVEKVWQLFGKDAPRVDVLWVCDQPACLPPDDIARPGTLQRIQPDPGLTAALASADGEQGGGTADARVYVVDPNGFVILRYAPGSDPAGLRADLVKLLKLI